MCSVHIAEDLLRRLVGALPPSIVVAGSELHTGKLTDWGSDPAEAVQPLALVLPRSTAEVAITMRICAEMAVPVVPQGGLTGLLGGGNAVSGSVLINLQRMNRICEIDPDAGTISVEAGATLQAVQDAAAAQGLFYPLDIGARGSCTIGGNIATNAGGNRVVRYGMTRDLVLGLEAVLADGTVVTSMNKMLKNNTGYDWKQVLIGSEGTLGIVTRAVLKLFPAPRSTETALCALNRFEDIYPLLARARARLSSHLSAFEVMWNLFYQYAVEGNSNPPLAAGSAAYVLIEASGGNPERDAEAFRSFLESCLEDGLIADATLPASKQQLDAIWAIRDRSGELVKDLQPLRNYDISIETSRIGAFVDTLDGALKRRWSGAEIVCFGHLADSNIHIFARVPNRPFPQEQIDELFYAHVRDWGGSVSAEIGIGLQKKAYLAYSRSPEELLLMRRLKGCLDPQGLMNPGKIF